MSPRAYRSAARENAAERNRLRIVAAAGKLLRAKGAAGFSLDAVARKAHVTRLTVYNQFGSRRRLLEAVFDDHAARGGLGRLPQAMGSPDPREGVRQVVEIFCDFWSLDHEAMTGLQGMGGTDTEFATAISARNERRRRIFGALLTRLAEQGGIDAEALTELRDMLFAITSLAFFAELARSGGAEKAAAQVKWLAAQVIGRGGHASFKSLDLL
ncbi:MAG TPA: TetR/AcrR family transcriptional regulator [Rhizomicrobium sp.]|nr:TetR/AcrR family transcriptional regulator [Rhizomicrobium sp.]